MGEWLSFIAAALLVCSCTGGLYLLVRRPPVRRGSSASAATGGVSPRRGPVPMVDGSGPARHRRRGVGHSAPRDWMAAGEFRLLERRGTAGARGCPARGGRRLGAAESGDGRGGGNRDAGGHRESDVRSQQIAARGRPVARGHVRDRLHHQDLHRDSPGAHGRRRRRQSRPASVRLTAARNRAAGRAAIDHARATRHAQRGLAAAATGNGERGPVRSRRARAGPLPPLRGGGPVRRAGRPLDWPMFPANARSTPTTDSAFWVGCSGAEAAKGTSTRSGISSSTRWGSTTSRPDRATRELFRRPAISAGRASDRCGSAAAPNPGR